MIFEVVDVLRVIHAGGPEEKWRELKAVSDNWRVKIGLPNDTADRHARVAGEKEMSRPTK